MNVSSNPTRGLSKPQSLLSIAISLSTFFLVVSCIQLDQGPTHTAQHLGIELIYPDTWELHKSHDHLSLADRKRGFFRIHIVLNNPQININVSPVDAVEEYTTSVLALSEDENVKEIGSITAFEFNGYEASEIQYIVQVATGIEISDGATVEDALLDFQYRMIVTRSGDKDALIWILWPVGFDEIERDSFKEMQDILKSIQFQ